MEWRLFEEGTIPEFTTLEFFEAHSWIPPGHQIGHSERMDMVVNAFDLLLRQEPTIKKLVDIGCGDGSFLERAQQLCPDHDSCHMWGYDAGKANVEKCREKNLNVRQADILTDTTMHFGDVTTITEVLEHLVDPHAFVASIPSTFLIATSPSAETDTWHYEHHAWAWDTFGYAKMIVDAGWDIIEQYECQSAQSYNHNTSISQPLRFQAIVARRR